MKFLSIWIYPITFLMGFISYVYYRNQFVPISSQQELIFVVGATAGLFVLGIIIGFIHNYYVKKYFISNGLFLLSIFLLLLSLSLYLISDILDVSVYSEYYLDRSVNVTKYSSLIHDLERVARYFGLAVSALSLYFFKKNIIVGLIFLILGIWGASAGPGIFYLILAAIILFIGVLLRYYEKRKTQ